MRSLPFLLSALALISGALFAQQPSPAFRAAVGVVALNLAVLDGERRYVGDLRGVSPLPIAAGLKGFSSRHSRV